MNYRSRVVLGGSCDRSNVNCGCNGSVVVVAVAPSGAAPPALCQSGGRGGYAAPVHAALLVRAPPDRVTSTLLRRLDVPPCRVIRTCLHPSAGSTCLQILLMVVVLPSVRAGAVTARARPVSVGVSGCSVRGLPRPGRWRSTTSSSLSTARAACAFRSSCLKQ